MEDKGEGGEGLKKIVVCITRRILGLHLPEMKQIVKALAKQADAREFLHAYYHSDKEFGSSHYCIDQYR